MENALYLVTGAAGHLGNTLVQQLLQAGRDVRALALPGEPIPFDRRRVALFRGDVRNPDSLRPFFTAPENRDLIVLHTAGIVSIASRFQQNVFDVNVTGTKNMLELAAAFPVKRFIHVSSVHAIAEPPDGQQITESNHFSPHSVHGLYAQTKAEATQLVLDAAAEGLSASVVHPSGILGPNDYGRGHLTQLVLDYLDGRLTACVKGGYDFVDVRDVAGGILSCVNRGKAGQCYILSNRYETISTILELLHQITGRRKIRTVLPLWFAKGTAPLAEAYYKLRRQPPLYTTYSLYTLTGNANFSHQKATMEWGYTPRPLEETLRDMVAWLSAHHRLKRPLETGNL